MGAEPTKRAVCLVRSAQSIWAADCLPANKGRASRVHGLIDAFNLDKLFTVKAPHAATDDELCRFHSEEYIRAVCSSEEYADSSQDDEDSQSDNQRFGLEYDCAVFDQMEQHVRYVAGGTISAAGALTSGDADIAIHWE
ncbi:hypothetical protein IWW45_007758, partial [Coemansia sp. RSA 485]